MPSLVTKRVIGRVVLPNDIAPANATINFQLTGYDTDDFTATTILNRTVSGPIGPDGDIDVTLWPSDRGERVRRYAVFVEIRLLDKTEVLDLGKIIVPEPDGPHDINDLLPVVPENHPETPISDAVQAALDLKADQATVNDQLQDLADRKADTDTVNAQVQDLDDTKADTITVDAQLALKTSVSDFEAHRDASDNPHAVTAEQVGLGSVDNTPDTAKPVSTPQQSALATKQNILAEGAFQNGDKQKLDALEDPSFLGLFESLAALQTAYPDPATGTYGYVDDGAGGIETWAWNGSAYGQSTSGGAETNASVLAKLLANPDTRVVTDDEKARVGGLKSFDFASRAEAEAATPPAPVIKISYLVNGFVVDLVRDASGTALTTADGEKWAPAGEGTPQHYGAVGDGVTYDTAAVEAWLEAGGGGTVSGSTHLIYPITTTNAVTVHCAPDTTFMLGAGWSNWGAPDGILQFRRDVTWHGGVFDGNRHNATVMAGLAGLRGTGAGDVQMNEYKAAIYVRASSNSIKVDIQDVEVRNSVNYGFLAVALTDAVTISGRVHRLTVRNSGSVARMDRCVGLKTELIEGYDLDNRIGGDDENWFPAFQHLVHQIRCVDSPIDFIFVNGIRGRPGEWLNSGSSAFINGFTQSSCVRCPVGRSHVHGLIISQGVATDTTPATIAEETSSLGFSDASNNASGVDSLDIEGGWSQGWELIAGYGSTYGRVKIRSNHARQGVENGSSGVNLHGGARSSEDVADFRFDTLPPVEITSLDIEGFHYGVQARHGHLDVGRLKIRGTRADGIYVSDLGNPIETGVSRDNFRASVTVGFADIQWCGGSGLRAVNGDTIAIYGGIIANNCQMSGYDDPTLSGAAFTRNAAVMYDNADADADDLQSITVNRVQMDGAPSFTKSSGASYVPGIPQPGTFETLPDPRLNTFFLVLAEGRDAEIGRRLTITGVDGAAQNVDVWIRKRQGPVLLVEVDTATYAGAWANNTTPLAGTWDLDGNELDGNGGALVVEMDGSGVVSTPNGHAALVTRPFNNEGYLMFNTIWGDISTISGDFTGGTIALVDVGYDYALAQTANMDVDYANVQQDYYAAF